MSEHGRSLRAELHELADTFETQAEPVERVASRLHGRLERRAGRSLAVVTVAAVGILLAVAMKVVPGPPDGGAPMMPALVGVFRTVQPEPDGRCVAVRLYETTPQDGRAFVFAWAGRDGCEARRSNLFSTTGRAEVVRLPAGPDGSVRAGIQVMSAPTAPEPLAGIVLILDPSSAAPGGTSFLGYRSLPTAGDDPAIELLRVDVLDLPYVPG